MEGGGWRVEGRTRGEARLAGPSTKGHRGLSGPLQLLVAVPQAGSRCKICTETPSELTCCGVPQTRDRTLRKGTTPLATAVGHDPSLGSCSSGGSDHHTSPHQPSSYLDGSGVLDATAGRGARATQPLAAKPRELHREPGAGEGTKMTEEAEHIAESAARGQQQQAAGRRGACHAFDQPVRPAETARAGLDQPVGCERPPLPSRPVGCERPRRQGWGRFSVGMGLAVCCAAMMLGGAAGNFLEERHRADRTCSLAPVEVPFPLLLFEHGGVRVGGASREPPWRRQPRGKS